MKAGKPGAAAPVSVVIPFFRDVHTIERAIRSVLEQTKVPAEIIVVDDSSDDDDSRAALARVIALDRRIRVLWRTINGGPGTARNEGWRAATQPFIAFLDADDGWHPLKIELQLAVMQRADEPSAAGHQVVRGSRVVELAWPIDSTPVTVGRLLAKNLLRTSTVMVRSDIPQRFDESLRYCEDYDLWLRILTSGGKCLLIRQGLGLSYKAHFGERGLSSHLWRMERGQNEVYRKLRRRGDVSLATYLICRAWGGMRFVARLLRSGVGTLVRRRRPATGA